MKYVNNFLMRHVLECRAVRQVEDKRVKALTAVHISEHIAVFQEIIDRYRIRDPRVIFDMDQTGSSFEKIIGRALRKVVRAKGQNLVQKTVRTKEDLNRVTWMPLVYAAGRAYTPFVVFPGKTPHYRVVRGEKQTLHSVLMKCTLYHRDPVGADSEIIYNWAKLFIDETSELRKGGQHLLLILDGYAGHLQFRTLDLFRRNRIMAVAMPSHTSHELQPLDVTVFGAYKSFLQKELHRASHVKKVFNAFDIGSMMHYAMAFIAPTITQGFVRCGIWNYETCRTNIAALSWLIDGRGVNGSIDLQLLMNSFKARSRSLLRDAAVEEEDCIRINTTSGAHVISDIVLSALKKRKEKQSMEAAKKQKRSSMFEARDYKEYAAHVRRLVELSERSCEQCKRMRESRQSRRFRQKLLLGRVARSEV